MKHDTMKQRNAQLRLLKLFLPEKQEAQNIDGEQEKKAEPEIGVGQLVSNVPRIKTGEHIARSEFVRCRGTRENRPNRSDNLGGEEGESDVESRKCVEEDHSEALMRSLPSVTNILWISRQGSSTYPLPGWHQGHPAIAKVLERQAPQQLHRQPTADTYRCWKLPKASGTIEESQGRWQRWE